MPAASKSPSRGPHARAFAPGLRCGVAGLCLLAQLVGMAHLALVQHATCLEHDALMHSEQARAAGETQQTALPPRSVQRRTLEQPAPDSAIHAEDHCLAAGYRRSELTTPSCEWSPAPPIPGPPPPRPRDAVEPPAPVALLRLAPKSSPPPAATA